MLFWGNLPFFQYFGRIFPFVLQQANLHTPKSTKSLVNLLKATAATLDNAEMSASFTQFALEEMNQEQLLPKFDAKPPKPDRQKRMKIWAQRRKTGVDPSQDAGLVSRGHYKGPMTPAAFNIALTDCLERQPTDEEEEIAARNEADPTGTPVLPLYRRLRVRVENVPKIVLACTEYLTRVGLDQEGLFRQSGAASDVAQLKYQIDYNRDFTFDGHDPHTVATLLKMWLQELPEPLLTYRVAFFCCCAFCVVPFLSCLFSALRKTSQHFPSTRQTQSERSIMETPTQVLFCFCCC
jgi:hypothetical protein